MGGLSHKSVEAFWERNTWFKWSVNHREYMGIAGEKWLQSKCKAWSQCCGTREETDEGNESYLSSAFYPFMSLMGTLVTCFGLWPMVCADALWYYKWLRKTHANGVFEDAQPLTGLAPCHKVLEEQIGCTDDPHQAQNWIIYFGVLT